MHVKISHESPLCLLKRSREYNDYCYALVHIFDKYPVYKDFYYESVKLGRHVLLDNGAFEEGKAAEPESFAKEIESLRPTEYVVPDVLEDTEKTIESFENWLKIYRDLPGRKIGVVQGNSWDDIRECYKYMSAKADKIAISFDYGFFGKIFPLANKTTAQMHGRYNLLSSLKAGDYINRDKPHHLLGCSNPMEFSFYGDRFPFIESLDTSSPIVHTIRGIKYPEDMSDWKKESIKLVDLLETPLSCIDQYTLKENLGRFKSFTLESRECILYQELENF